ncbi:MAG TPA: DUF5615 family PIN-like protein [Armatimonadota bacterium]
MKLLFDQNLSCKLCSRLADVYPGSDQVRSLGLGEADDRAVWEFAKSNGLTIGSQDSDFADMAALYGSPAKVIWLRCGNQPTDADCKLIRDQARAIADFELEKTAACLEIF